MLEKVSHVTEGTAVNLLIYSYLCHTFPFIKLQVEWVYLNAAGGAKTLSKNCEIIEENNDASGLEKYVMSCVNTNSMYIYI